MPILGEALAQSPYQQAKQRIDELEAALTTILETSRCQYSLDVACRALGITE
jgi:hypothetical protein